MTKPDSNATLPALLDYVQNTDWVMYEPTLRQMVEIVDRHVRGVRLSEEEIAGIVMARNASAAARGADPDGREFRVTSNGTAVIPVFGVIAKYARMVNGCSQPRGTSIEAMNEQLDHADTDPAIKSAVLQIESPGGQINGLADTSDRIFELSHKKPVIAHIDDMGASAAYWITAQANRAYANQTAAVGSIGVYSVIIDYSKRAEQMGLDVHLISSGPNKGAGYPGTVITEDQLAVMQERIDNLYEMFLQAVIRGRDERGLTMDELRTLADGRIYEPPAAMKGHLLDGVMTFQQALTSARPAVRERKTQVSVQKKTSAIGNDTEEANTQTMDQTQTGEHDMAESKTKTDTTATEQEAAAKNEQTLAEAKAVAVKEERERISAISTALTGEHLATARQKAINDNLSVDQAKALAFEAEREHSKTQLAARDEEIKTLQARTGAIRRGNDVVEQTNTDGADNPAGSDIGAAGGVPDADAKDYESAVAKRVEKGEGDAEARLNVAKKSAAMKAAHGAYMEKERKERRNA